MCIEMGTSNLDGAHKSFPQIPMENSIPMVKSPDLPSNSFYPLENSNPMEKSPPQQSQFSLGSGAPHHPTPIKMIFSLFFSLPLFFPFSHIHQVNMQFVMIYVIWMLELKKKEKKDAILESCMMIVKMIKMLSLSSQCIVHVILNCTSLNLQCITKPIRLRYMPQWLTVVGEGMMVTVEEHGRGFWWQGRWECPGNDWATDP